MPGLTIPIYGNQFSVAIEEITQVVDDWVHSDSDAAPDVDRFSELVYLKQNPRLIVHASKAFCEFFEINGPIQGPLVNEFLDAATLGIAVKSDELLFSSGQTIELDHTAARPDGESFQIRTHKRWIGPNRRHVCILGIARIVAKVEPTRTAMTEQLAGAARRYQMLDEDSRALCRSIAVGHSQRETAELLGCTTRTIENRRNRIMAELGVCKPIDIVKLMVRLAEHGVISADF